MRVVRHIEKLDESARGAAIAIGNFDGLHKGHHAVLAAMSHHAEALDAPRAVMTFDPHPRRFFRPDSPTQKLYPLSHKLRLLELLGVEIVYLLRFNAAFASQTAEAFMQDVLVEALDAKAVVTGYDFCFGKARSGNAEKLAAFAESTQHFIFEAVAPQKQDDTVYSSSTIRDYVSQGRVTDAAALLGRPYSITGTVRRGEQLGRSLGFPTANIRIPSILKPKYGVYAVRAILADETVHAGVANFGKRPTVDGLNELLEVHLFDFDKDIYGQRIEIAFADFLRPEHAFASVDELKAQIAEDCETARATLKGERAA